MSTGELLVALRRVLPPALLIPWAILAAPAGYLVGRLLYEETYLTWVDGPQMVGFALAHSGYAMLLILSGLLMAVWVLAAASWIVVRLVRHRPLVRANYFLPGATAVALLLVLLPESLLREGMVATVGPGVHADELFVNAAATGQLGVVKMLVARGIAIDARTSDGATALSGAAVEGDTVMVGFLLARGAALNMPGDNGSRALAGALDMHHTEIARTLLLRGAEPVPSLLALLSIRTRSCSAHPGASPTSR